MPPMFNENAILKCREKPKETSNFEAMEVPDFHDMEEIRDFFEWIGRFSNFEFIEETDDFKLSVEGIVVETGQILLKNSRTGKPFAFYETMEEFREKYDVISNPE